MRELVTTFVLLLGAVLLRPVSAMALECDLVNTDSSTNTNGACNYQRFGQPMDGSQMSFMQMANNDPVEQGYRSGFRSAWLAAAADLTHAHNLRVHSVPIVMIDGGAYQQLRLDSNQMAVNSLLSQDGLQVFGSNAAAPNGYLNRRGLVYEIDTAGGSDNNLVKMDDNLEHGSGSGDIWLSQPDALLVPFQDRYPHSPFGTYLAKNDRSEEWFRISAIDSSIPEPGGGAMLIAGLLGMCAVARRRIFSI
jgi:hypothetical protein